MHLHGTSDDMVPMAGRSIGARWRQGDVRQGLAILREADGCPAAPAREETVMGLSCEHLGRLRQWARAAAVPTSWRASDA